MVFSKAELEQFITDGFVTLRGGFPRELAETSRRFVWDYILSWKKCTSSGQPMVQILRGFHEPPFDQVLTRRMCDAFDEIAGLGRWIGSGPYYLPDASGQGQWIEMGYGYWTILFPGFPGPGGWHVDGIHRFHLDSREQGLVRLLLFSDVGPDDGGTPMVRGSHREVARMIARHEPAGIGPGAEFQERLKEAGLLDVDARKIVHVTGEAGDVALMHPLLIHGFGPNRGTKIRFACNPLLPLKERVQLNRADGAYSPVEEAIRQAVTK